ncbi:oxidoreductase [Thioalkalivibrio sp. XN279]|uniref:oxidoreductase n=1 Tax=Thioalkalivibrio sp. XN279 TaxID=2714953 RepID=UPI0014093930|nr:oxidoreductase [Thioalkalivibrio sp. XN279]NHA15797.1 oxidoreductase [Thioalkalivibrio sp. XN279]
MSTFKAFRIHQAGKGVEARLEDLSLDDLGPGDVVIRGHWSSINYKDALAATGKGRILRRFPLVGGIDVAGEVVSSEDPRYRPGDAVLVTGCGLSEEHDGGYAEYSRVRGDWVIPVPDGLDTRAAMQLGTAGFTAGLAIHRLEHNGLAPDKGPVIVTGATGGVGSLALDMLAGRGYAVTALTGKAASADYLRELGAAEVLVRGEFEMGTRPLEKATWAGAVDNLGGETLAWLTRTMDWWGSIASIGLAQSHELHTTVMPFILRGANILGVNSVATPRDLRLQVWARLASDLKPRHLHQIADNVVSLSEIATAFDAYIDGAVRGRTLVDLRA